MLFDSRLTTAQKASFFAQLSAMLKAGMSLQHSLTLAAQHTRPDFQRYLQQVTSALQSGENFSSALTITKSSYQFDGWILSLIKLGEYSGNLAEVCSLLSQDFLEQMVRDRIYNSIRFSSLTTLWCLLVLLAAIFQGHHLLTFGFWLFWLFWGLILFLLSFQFGGYFSAQLKFISVVAKIQEAQTMINFSLLSIPLACSIPVLTGLDLLRSRFPQRDMIQVLAYASKKVTQGYPLSVSLQGNLPAIARQMIITGEETGHLDTALQKIQSYYTQELERCLKQLQGVLRPVSILAMGGIVLITAMRLLNNLTQSLP